MTILKFFQELFTGEWFHYGDKPNRFLTKYDNSRAISPEGLRDTNPNVIVFPETLEPRGDPNGGSNDHNQD